MGCRECPRRCGAERDKTPGFCGVKGEFVLARAGLHQWEEPCVSGTRGSGAIFFAGCSLGCCFCQNYAISRGNAGKAVSAARLKEIFHELKAAGAHNINLVTASHYTAELAPLLADAPLPVVWNSSAYELTETLRLLEGKVSVYLPDFKFFSPEKAAKYANAPDYPAVAREAIKEMVRQVGPVEIKDGLIRRGVIVRHLLLPGAADDARAIIDWVADTFPPGTVLFSLMSQYTPYRPLPFEELNRRLEKKEYLPVRNHLRRRGLGGYEQELSSAKEEYTPAFDLTGVEKGSGEGQ